MLVYADHMSGGSERMMRPRWLHGLTARLLTTRAAGLLPGQRRRDGAAPLSIFVVLLLWLSSVPVCAEWHSASEDIMGTRVAAEIWHTDSVVAGRLLASVMLEMRRVDARYSTHKDTSELSRLNAAAGRAWVQVSPELLDLLARSAHVSKLTEGAFDVTYASVGRYYDFRARRKPDAAQVADGLEAINYQYVELDPAQQRVRYRHPAVYVDLGGIAKGYAVDRCINLLTAAGVTQASVSAGGDSRIVGDRGGKPWTVAVRHPREDDKFAAILPLVDTAVSTSGDYERFFDADGVRYHHIIDPHTGDSARRSLSVTVLGDEAMFTDALSTSVFVLGPQRGLQLINKLPGVDAIIVEPGGRLLYSAELEQLQQ